MLQKPKGTQDFYGESGYNYLNLTKYIENFMELYNYEYIKTPMFESSELFKRGVGESTDIVNKETYDFKDKGERNLTLKPEETASVVRAFIENKIYAENEVSKFFYITPCFRYERPQSGRFREFNQYGVEVFGSDSPYMDAEVILIAYKLLNNLGIKNLKVKINSLGNEESRKKYREALVEYFKDKIDSLCETCQERYKTNPLRILDCKVDQNNEVLKNAPKTIFYLDEESNKFFEDVKNILSFNEIPFEIDTNLVRGLDYYTHTVFEIVSDDSLAICGGGRYNNLVKELGGPVVPAVGFACGIERILKILKDMDKDKKGNKIDIYIMNLFDTNETFNLLNSLRDSGFITETDFKVKSMKSLWKQVEKYNPNYVVMLGEDEIKGGYLTVKDNLTKESIQIERENAEEYFDMNF
ncbi:MAG: histidine--tRNA ligase [Bacilli bacterium]|nr:histidine--tRNA ligase [Bacilli bacterium]